MLSKHAGSAVSEYDVIKVMQVCFDVNVITFVFKYFWCVFAKQLRQNVCFLIFDVYEIEQAL